MFLSRLLSLTSPHLLSRFHTFTQYNVSRIEPNNVAIDYNKVSQKLDLETLYQPGRIFLGVGHEMIVYPTIQMTRELHSQVGRTKDGLSVNFMCNYQFQYQKEITALSNIYLQYKGEHLSR